MKKYNIAAVLLSLLVCVSLLLCGCGGDTEVVADADDTNVVENTPSDFTLSVKSEGGLPLKDVEVSVYADEAKTDLVWAASTDSEGTTAFVANSNTEYFVFLENVPEGYAAETFYKIKDADSEIAVPIQLLSDEEAEGKVFRLGDVFFDFTVTDYTGETYTLSELLKTKKAVVLNIWFHSCGPCMMEFPYLQAAYETAPESLELLALNYMDATDETLSAFAEEAGYTIPFVCADTTWLDRLGNPSAPTTVVIDRYGTVAMIHKGYIIESGVFETIFEYFTAEDYTQTTVSAVEEIM